MPKPDPGNKLTTAKLLNLSSPKVIRDTIGGKDQFDFFRIKLTAQSSFNLTLNKLKNNANVALLNASGRVLKSQRLAKKAGSITTTLNPGTFFIRINAKGSSAKYKLKLAAFPTNTAPKLSGSLSLTVSRGSADKSSVTSLNGSFLKATDAQQNPDQLTYTLTSLPKRGSLLRNGAALAVGATFSQSEINNGQISYKQEPVFALPNSAGVYDITVSGSNVAWIANNGKGGGDVFFYNGSTGIVKQLSDNKSTFAYDVQVSGSTVVWGLEEHIQYSVDGGAVQTISNDPNLNDNFSVVSGTKIVFRRDDTRGKNIAGDGIYLYDINSKSLTQLRSGTEDVYDAAIDGSLVAWQRNFNQTSNADVQYSVNGAPFKTIDPSTNFIDGAPRVSGSKIAFFRYNKDGSDTGRYEAWIYDTNNSTLTQLTSGIELVAKIGISGSNVVLQQSSSVGGKSRISYSINGNPTQGINFSAAFDDTVPYISGNLIAFQRDDTSGTTGDGIHLFDTTATTNRLTRISNSSTDQLCGFSDRNAVWISGSAASAQAFFYDGSTTSDRFDFTVSDGKLSTNGSLNIAISQ